MAEENSDSDAMERVRETGEYFRRLLTLVPYLVSEEVTKEPQHQPDGTDGQPTKKKKKKKQKQMTEGKVSKDPTAQQKDSSKAAVRRGKKRPAQDEVEADEAESGNMNFDFENAAPPLPKQKKKGKSKPEQTQVQSTKHKKDAELKKQQKKRVSQTMADAINGTTHSVEEGVAASRDELKQKLHHKIQEVRAKKGLSSGAEQGVDSQKKKKKKDKKKKKKKDKQKEEKTKAKKSQEEEEKKKKSGNGAGAGEDVPPAKKPLFNMRGSLMFNKMSFDYKGEKDRAGRSELVGKDYRRILQKLEKRKEKVKKLKEKDEGMALALEDKLAWKDAVSKAAGLKVKDDEFLVKRSLKRKTNIKNMRKKKWRDRQKTVRKNIEEKQAKREKNIEARKGAKKEKKYKKMVKKGRIVPGMDK